MAKYYKKISDEDGNEFLLAVNITGHGAPTEDTEAEPGMCYLDEDSEHGDLYKCIGVLVTETGTVYRWKKLAGQEEVERLSEAIANLGGTLTEPAEDDIPKVFIDGVKPTTKDDVLAEMRYVSKSDNFHAYLEIKCQGTSSMSYAKKNFTIKMYSDEVRETKLKKSFKDWNHEGNKYVLKANYIDHSHARNIVSARLWDEVVASRPDYNTLPEEMRNSPRNGAVDGFPIKVYYNGTYEGIYTWNIGKDDWMWNMDEDNTNHVLLCAETNTDGTYAENACNFRALWNGVDGTNWSVEVGTNSTALKTSLNNLIQFVMDNDGDDFKSGIGAYLDVQSAIDYYLFQYVICGLDGLAKNMLLATYDNTVWRCGAYDLDSTFGLWWNGTQFVSAEFACPEDYQEQFSLLWERIEANYVDELKARYAELRADVLSYSHMVTHFERFMDVIGLDLYEEDLTVYSAIPLGSTNNIKQIRNYIRDRLTYVDGEIDTLGVYPTVTSISATYTGGSVEVGTELSALTGITVTATYFDGSTETVTDYTLNGSIVEGDNTITVTYSGLTTTFTVVGYVEETEPYLLNNDGAYIKLGISHEDGNSYEICMQDENISPTISGEQHYFGSRFTTLKTPGQAYLAWALQGQYNPYVESDDYNKKHTFKVDASNLYVDGITNATATWGTFTYKPEMVLFGANGINSASGFYLFELTRQIKFYYLKIWNSSGELTHNYLPALKDGVACVYDEVTSTYLYNSSENGSFTYVGV